jgi:hypothetical protein
MVNLVSFSNFVVDVIRYIKCYSLFIKRTRDLQQLKSPAIHMTYGFQVIRQIKQITYIVEITLCKIYGI